jgi:hypothetical protein
MWADVKLHAGDYKEVAKCYIKIYTRRELFTNNKWYAIHCYNIGYNIRYTIRYNRHYYFINRYIWSTDQNNLLK